MGFVKKIFRQMVLFCESIGLSNVENHINVVRCQRVCL